MTEEFRRERIGIPGPSGHTITAADWTDVRDNRLPAVERVASSLNPYPLPGTGRYISPQSHGLGGTRTSSAIAAESIVWTPIFTSVSFATLSLCVEVTVAQPGASLRLGLYTSARALLRDFGTCDAATTGWKEVTLATTVTVPAGMNWLGVHANAVTGVEIRQLTEGLAMYHSGNVGASFMVAYPAVRGSQPFGPLPASFGTSLASSVAPLLGIRIDG